ncbi:MAG: universal stress protein [Deltaproteobacteria bacterium]|nr:universal stress protein [Deltaproteobacteria bacterium]
MGKIKKILAPTDLSNLSEAGVRYALKMAKELGAEVLAYHVVDFAEIQQYSKELRPGATALRSFPPPADIMERFQIALAQFLGDRFGDLLPFVTVREKVEIGRPDESIVEQARKDGSDLIVISTHGRTGLSHAFVGSVTEKVVRTAPCPVLSVRPGPDQKEAARAAASA